MSRGLVPGWSGFAWHRVGAVCLRHLYVMRSSPIRLLEMAYWPTVQMVMWGFISQFFTTQSSWLVQAAGALLAAVLLWDVLFRANLGLSLSFMEEMWARNLGHLFVSPLRPYEFIVALITMSAIRTTIGLLPAALLAIPLFHYNIFAMGLPLVGFFLLLLITGWSVGLGVSALVLRFGLGAESLAWVLIFALAPLSGIYYPISTLPGWLQTVAWWLPSSHVFEGMRVVLTTGTFDWSLWWTALVLDLGYLSLLGGLFLYTFRVARRRGLLLNVGE
ncbi:ABC transporter permease [Insolitispirillum peregrinum]|uniref:Transport permease protein n=1 Tax=Insolitispirillum peregrinum TaxID=80876 RepID=A0A1N7JI10_9PROT|nr:ABC transporter permease [Insolitispirillum peregrinum]SIS48950.1 ABC-2 type transport system permease protein [Insolitispirillum peregrinum]